MLSKQGETCLHVDTKTNIDHYSFSLYYAVISWAYLTLTSIHFMNKDGSEVNSAVQLYDESIATTIQFTKQL